MPKIFETFFEISLKTQKMISSTVDSTLTEGGSEKYNKTNRDFLLLSNK
jgi:hypothetical protein